MKNMVIGMINWLILMLNVFVLVLAQMPEEISKSNAYYQMIYAVIIFSIFVIVAIPVGGVAEWILTVFTKLNKNAIDGVSAFLALCGGLMGNKIIGFILPSFMNMVEYIRNLGLA